jgi:hypothetical protein
VREREVNDRERREKKNKVLLKEREEKQKKERTEKGREGGLGQRERIAGKRKQRRTKELVASKCRYGIVWPSVLPSDIKFDQLLFVQLVHSFICSFVPWYRIGPDHLQQYPLEANQHSH